MLHNQRRTGSHLRLVWWPVAFVAATNPPQCGLAEKRPPSHRPGSGVFFDALAKIEIVASDTPIRPRDIGLHLPVR